MPTRAGRGQAGSLSAVRPVCFYSAEKGAPAALPFLLCPVSGVMYPQFEHGNQERITAVCSLGVLGKAVRLVQSVTIPAPVDVIFLCRILTFTFDVLDFLRNQTADFFLTVCQIFTPFLMIPTARACALARLRRGLTECCRACCAAAAPRSATAAGRLPTRQPAGIRSREKGCPVFFLCVLRPCELRTV